MPSASQIAANQRNAQLSTGPTSETGKAKSSLNAVKTALTGRTVLLPSDDAAEYERHISAYEKELQPVFMLHGEEGFGNASASSLSHCSTEFRLSTREGVRAIGSHPESNYLR
jgi:hypothetical protein